VIGPVTPDRVRENMRMVAAAVQPETQWGGLDAAGQRRLYFQALQSLQTRWPLPPAADEPIVDFDLYDDGSRSLLARLMEVDALPADFRFEGGERERRDALLRKAWGVVDAAGEAFETLTRSMISCILFADDSTAGAASSGETLGAMWLSPPEQWDEVDYADSLVHESTHMALFLEEMVRGVYRMSTADMGEKKYWVRSAIRKEARPFDASFHSAAVAVVLIDFHLRAGRAERARELSVALPETLAQMSELQGDVLTPNGSQILDEMKSDLEAAAVAAT
jgi:hypothetical protein